MSTDALSPLLVEPITGGLVELPDTDGVADRLAAAGWAVHRIGDFQDRDGFYRQIAGGLGFPDYSGHNLDALWDSLGDVPARTAVIIDWRPFATAEPEYAARVQTVLAERAALESPFAVILDTGAAHG